MTFQMWKLSTKVLVKVKHDLTESVIKCGNTLNWQMHKPHCAKYNNTLNHNLPESSWSIVNRFYIVFITSDFLSSGVKAVESQSLEQSSSQEKTSAVSRSIVC